VADLTIKNIPESLQARLEAEAQRSFRSAEQELLYRLQRSFDADDARMTAIHAKWVYEALNSGDAKPLTEDELTAAVQRGVQRAKARKATVR
jgi:plasmid stability protein